MADGATDPICGKAVDPLRARAVGIFGGVTYYFCSAACKAKFHDPRQAEPAAPAPVPPGERRQTETRDKPAPAPEPRSAAAIPTAGDEAADSDLDHAPPSRRSSWTVLLLLFALGGAVLVFLLRR